MIRLQEMIAEQRERLENETSRRARRTLHAINTLAHDMSRAQYVRHQERRQARVHKMTERAALVCAA